MTTSPTSPTNPSPPSLQGWAALANAAATHPQLNGQQPQQVSAPGGNVAPGDASAKAVGGCAPCLNASAAPQANVVAVQLPTMRR